jgi:hypothetical protein
LPIPDALMACVISRYSAGDRRVDMNFHRFSRLGSAGRPTGFGSLIVSFSLAAEF